MVRESSDWCVAHCEEWLVVRDWHVVCLIIGESFVQVELEFAHGTVV